MRTRRLQPADSIAHQDPAPPGGVFVFSGCKEILQFFVTGYNHKAIPDPKPAHRPRFKGNDLVPVHAVHSKAELPRQLRTLQARWDAETKLWYVRFGLICGTALGEQLAELPA